MRLTAPPVVAVLAMATIVGAVAWRAELQKPRLDAVEARAAPPATLATPPVAEYRSRPTLVSAYLAFAERTAPKKLPLDHEYTSEGLRLLADAIAAADPSPLSKDRAARLRAAADLLQADPRSLDHADVARKAFILAARAISTLFERGSIPAGGLSDLPAVARAIRPGDPLRDQAAEVDRFFDLAASLIDAKTRAGSDAHRY